MSAAPAPASRDFRAAAVAACDRALLARSPAARASPTNAGISYCLPALVNAGSLVLRLKLLAIVSLSLGIGGMICGGIIAIIAKDEGWLLLPAALCWFGGTAFCFAPSLLSRRLVARHLRTHLGDFWADPHSTPDPVSVENARTYNKMKVIADDVGIVIIHPDSQCIQIEGIFNRYLVYATDLVHLDLHANGKTIMLSYHAAGELLELAIIPQSLITELKRQTIGSAAELFARFQHALILPLD